MTAGEKVKAGLVEAQKVLAEEPLLTAEARLSIICTLLGAEIAAQLADIAFELKRSNDAKAPAARTEERQGEGRL